MSKSKPVGVIGGVSPDGQFLVKPEVDGEQKQETERIPKAKNRSRVLFRKERGQMIDDGEEDDSSTWCGLSCPCPLFSYPKKNRFVSKSQSKQTHDPNKPPSNFILPPQTEEDKRLKKKTLVLDLDETLVHSAFEESPNWNHIVPIRFEGADYKVYVWKRPGVDLFLKEVAPLFETIIFTASLQLYANPVIDAIDPTGLIKYRLFRDSCVPYEQNFVKDLSRLGRDLSSTIIIDNAPPAYLFHPENGVPCTSWFFDQNDTELLSFIPVLKELAQTDGDVRIFVGNYLKSKNKIQNNSLY